MPRLPAGGLLPRSPADWRIRPGRELGSAFAASPGGQVGAGGEPAHVRARLGDDAPGGATAQPGMDSACTARAAQVPAAIACGPQVMAISVTRTGQAML